MLNPIINILTNFIVSTISSLGYGGVIMLMAIESAAIPLPSEVIMPFAGFLVFQGRFTLWGITLAGSLGSSAGSALLYFLAHYLGRPVIERYGKYFLISHHDLSAADKFFGKYGNLSAFIGRLLPIVRTFISIPAGLAKMPFWRFLGYSFIGSLIWSYFLGYLGLKLGENWHSLRQQFQGLESAVAAGLVLFTGFWIYRHLRRIKKSGKR